MQFAKSATKLNKCKILKFQLDNLVDLKTYWKTRIYYLLAKIGADTAENEQHFAGILTKFGSASRVAAEVRPVLAAHVAAEQQDAAAVRRNNGR